MRKGTVRYGEFEWDDRKAQSNFRKHRIHFEEAASVFLDDLAVPFEDSLHPERLILVGMSVNQRVLLVVFAEYLEAGIIRIISARRATRAERSLYEEESN